MFIRAQLTNREAIFQVFEMERIGRKVVFKGITLNAFIECKDEEDAKWYFGNLTETLMHSGVFSEKIGDYPVIADLNSDGARDFRPVRGEK